MLQRIVCREVRSQVPPTSLWVRWVQAAQPAGSPPSKAGLPAVPKPLPKAQLIMCMPLCRGLTPWNWSLPQIVSPWFGERVNESETKLSPSETEAPPNSHFAKVEPSCALAGGLWQATWPLGVPHLLHLGMRMTLSFYKVMRVSQ